MRRWGVCKGAVRRSVVWAGALFVAGCGGTTTRVAFRIETVTQTVTTTVTRNRTVVTHSTSSQARRVTATPASSGTGALSVHDFNGDTLEVKASGLIDPATPANAQFGPPSGSRYVAVELVLTNPGHSTISSDANSNTTLLGSDGQAHTPEFYPVVECTNFSSGQYSLLPGDSERGCVTFSVPDGVNVKSVQFSLGNGTVQFNSG